jgi:hypothetical protein
MKAERTFLQAVLLIGAVFLAPSDSVFGCTCSETFTPPCAAFQRADLVFVGTVDRVTEPTTTGDVVFHVSAHFVVERVYKGKPVKEVSLDVAVSECTPKLEVNEKYFVYAHNGPSGKMEIGRCSRTKPIDAADPDLSYVKSLADPQNQVFVMGSVLALPENDLKETKVIVSGEGGQVETALTNNLFFKVKVAGSGRYSVRLVFPFEVYVSASSDTKIVDPEGTTVEYFVNLREGECDYREVLIKKGGSATVSGVALDGNGLPVPGLLLQLQPYNQDGNFSDLTQKLARADEQGRYTFTNVAGGRYVLGVNLEGTPALSTPYPKTFFPGVSDFHQATVLEIKKGQQLSIGPFQIPPKLAKRKITGRLIWGDGKPVTRSHNDPPNLSQAILYLLSPVSLQTIVPFDSEGNKITMDADGNFSFVGYEGYEYIVHAHAFKDKDKPFHSSPVKLKIPADPKPLILILSEPGTGEDRGEISKDLVQEAGDN